MSIAWAYLASFLGAAGGLVGGAAVVMLGHLASLCLFMVGAYRRVVEDWAAYGRELKSAGDEIVEQAAELAFLLQITHAIGASLNLSVVLDRVSESVARALDADWAYVLLPEEGESAVLTLAARYGWWGRRWMQDTKLPRAVVIKLEDFSLLHHAIVRRRQILANQPEEYEQFDVLHERMARPHTGPTLVQPLFLDERSSGILLLGRLDRRRTFSLDDGKLCQALAAQVAVAINNARVHRRTKRERQELLSLLQQCETDAKQHKALWDAVSVGILMVSKPGKIVHTNAAARRILCLRPGEDHGEVMKRFYGELLAARGSGQGEETTFVWKEKTLEGSMAPVVLANGEIAGYVSVFRDVSRELRREQLKSRYLSSVARDLRSPMTTVRGYTELLRSGAAGTISPKQSEFLDTILTAGERMGSMVNSLVAVAEMTRGPIEIELKRVDLGGLIEDAVSSFKAEAAAQGVQFTVTVPRDLRPAQGDPQRLRQIVDKLLENAARNAQGEGPIRVVAAETELRVARNAVRPYLVVSVHDDGTASPPNSGRLEPGARPLSDEVESADVGLLVVKTLVEAHGGRIWVEDEPGVGRVISFVIPAAYAAGPH
jgi:signal transduction histidine kinase